MNRFLVIGFKYCKSFYYSLILCKPKTGGAEYRITVMNGDIEKELCSNNVIREKDGHLEVEPSGNQLQDGIKTEIAKALGKTLGKPLKEAKLL